MEEGGADDEVSSKLSNITSNLVAKYRQDRQSYFLYGDDDVMLHYLPIPSIAIGGISSSSSTSSMDKVCNQEFKISRKWK